MKYLFAIGFLLLSSPVWGQFEKFKSKTQFGKKKEKKTPVVIPRRTPPDDVFGRQSGINTVKGEEREKRFVNLNPETAFGPEVVKNFDHPDTTLTELTKFMQKLTGIKLIMDKELKGKVSILSPSPITIGDAWKAYLTALNANNYSLVKSGAFYRIVSTRDIRYVPTKIYTGNYTPATDNYVMRIIPLKNIDATEVMRSLRGFVTRTGRIIENKQTNTIIIQDTGTNINRMVNLIKFIDVPGHEERLQIIKVRHSSAQEIAALLDKILGQTAGAKGRLRSPRSRRSSASRSSNISKIIADPRTNTIIAMANAEGARRLRSLIAKLDSKRVASTGGKIHVYYLNHGDAEALAKTLGSLVSSNSVRNRRSPKSPSLAGRNQKASLFNDTVKITADKDNNALVVTASPTDYLTVKEVIKKLDIPRDQVYVEGLIMETSVSRARGFGVSIVGAYGSGAAQKAGFSDDKNAGLLSLLTNQITNLGGLFAGIGMGKKIQLNDPTTGKQIQVNSVNALISAIASHANSNVLATPQILALDNTPAVFETGESIPVPVLTTAANGSTSTSTRNEKVGLTLKITPQINKVTRFIKLKISQKVDNFTDKALPDGVKSIGLATVNRAAETTVVVRDRDTIAMGGLMRDEVTSREAKVPLLGDIPVLGWLFKNRSTSIAKVSLLFFLTPRILANYQKSAARTMRDLVNRRAAHLKEAQEEDPFIGTAKALYDKSHRQEESPLYDTSETQIYRDENDSPGISPQEEEEKEEDVWQEGGDQVSVGVPNYRQIAKNARALKGE